MAILVGHTELCDIVINGPINRRPVTPGGAFVEDARVCTCGGELIDTALFAMGPQDWLTEGEVRAIVAESAGGWLVVEA